MALWKISEDGPRQVPTTRFKDEQLLEEHLETWIAEKPEILGEPLLVVGRQVQIPDTKDRLDLLALDPQGMTVVIELKRGALRDPVDIQALRYASYIAKWSFDELESLAKTHLGHEGDSEFNFNDVFETFCEETRGEVPTEINADQRVIIVGGSVREKLGSVALWLREHRVDIKLVEVRAYKERDSVLVEPKVLVPLEVSRFEEVGKGRTESSPWLADGRVWHLEKRCSPGTRDMLLTLEGVIEETVEAEGPHWNQKYYVAFRKNNFNWLAVNTRPTQLLLDFKVAQGTFDQAQLAERLDVEEFDRDESLSEKLNLPSSITLKKVGERLDRIWVRAKEGDFDFETPEFREFLFEAFQACPR